MCATIHLLILISIIIGLESKGIIGLLTGGGDVPGLNPAIRGVTIRAIREGYKIIGIRRGWKGLVEVIRDKGIDNSQNFFEITEDIVNKSRRTGGTFLHSSRTRASHVPKSKEEYTPQSFVKTLGCILFYLLE